MATWVRNSENKENRTMLNFIANLINVIPLKQLHKAISHTFSPCIQNFQFLSFTHILEKDSYLQNF